jgi:hypothetical protein
MEHLNLADAFAKYGGKTGNRLRTLSAIAEDGAMILSCTPPYFARPGRGVLRYEDRLSREVKQPKGTELLGQHLTLARDGELPIRMVVISDAPATGSKSGRSIHVRTDLVGKVTMFDGDHFIVDFTRPQEVRVPAAGRRK